jgi:hypothetical protein
LLQWLEDPGPGIRTLPNNLDAAFKMQSQQPTPSALLLHYNYGATALKHWGCGLEVLKTHKHPARPKAVEPAPMGPLKLMHDQTIEIHKYEAAQNVNQGDASKPTSGEQHRDGHEGMVESEHNRQRDAQDLVFSLWLNAPDAKEYRRKKEEEKREDLERWRQGIIH